MVQSYNVEDLRAERRRAVAAISGAATSVLLVLWVGGAIAVGAALAALSAFAAIAAVYLLAAAQGDAAQAVEAAKAEGDAPSERTDPAAVRTGRLSAGEAANRASTGALSGSAASAARITPSGAIATPAAVRASLLSALVEALPDPVVLVDPSGRVALANQPARDTLGVTAIGQMLAASVRDPEVLDAAARARRGVRTQVVDYRASGLQERHLRAVVVGLSAEGAEPGYAVIAVHDETMVRRSERMRVDFLANASHELRTPLASLSGFIETLRGHARQDTAARDRFLAIMQDQAERMRRLIDDLLSLSRIELNEHVPPTGVADLAAIAGDVIDATSPLAAERGVTFSYERGASRAPVVGDRDQLIQVVQNLVDNAIKYTPPGGVVRLASGAGADAARVSRPREPGKASSERFAMVEPSDAPDLRYAWVSVEDSGPGIPRQLLPRLSERFFRVEGSDVTERSGTGLGLAIVKHIMSRHRGGVFVESKPGAGSCFTVCVPHTREYVRDAGSVAAAPEVR